MKNLRIITVAVLVAIMLLVVALPTNAAFDGVTVKVTSNVGNGTEVKAGDEIVYNVKMKNTSTNDYVAPTILVLAPDQTKIINVEVDQDIEDGMKQVEEDMAVCAGLLLQSNSEVNFKVTVKINEDATGEIKFANATEDDEEPYGLTLAILVASDVTDEEMDNFTNVMDNLGEYDSLEDVQNKLGNKFYFDIVKDDQSNPIKTQETEEPVEETTEEQVEEAKEESAQEETKTEENKEESTKPSKLPKTGMEYNVCALIAGIVMLAVGIKLIK